MIVKPPTADLLGVCDCLDTLIGEVVRAKRDLFPHLGEFEAPVEASVLLNLVIRSVEGIVELARVDMVLLPAAITLARSAFEGGLRTRWLLKPDGEFEREARWLAYLAEEVRMWERLAGIASETGDPVPAFASTAQGVRSFWHGVKGRMPSGISIPSSVPNLREIARELGVERYYISYVLLSQYVHGSHYAGQTYRRGFGTAKRFGEEISSGEWAWCLRIAWWSLYNAAHRLIEVAKVPEVDIGTEDQLHSLEACLRAVELESTRKGAV